MTKLLPAILASGVLIAACASAADKPPPRGIAPPARIPDPVVPAASGEKVSIASVPLAVRRAIVADAAKRFVVDEDSVVLINSESVTWNDGAMGCPEPGRMYTQMLVPGFRVTAKTTSGQMLYHTDSRGTVVTCGTGYFQPGAKQLPANPAASEPRTQPPQPRAPDR
jgi:hypothetical protein